MMYPYAAEMERPLNVFLLAYSSVFFFFFFFAVHHASRVLVSAQNSTVSVDVGVILDLGSIWGKRSQTSISMAVDDFYAVHGHYATRMALNVRDSGGEAIGAAAAAVDLLKNVQVSSIIGPQTSHEADFVIQMGNKTHVPVLSFSASSPSLSPAHAPFFVRTTTNDSSQVGAIAGIVQHFGWREAVPVYEDSEYGAGIVAFLIDALQAVDARVPYRSVIASEADDVQIDKELYKLMTMQTRVFIVHMVPDLGTRLFRRANELGMMDDGYVWITTDGVTDVIDHLDQETVAEAMQGVIGVRSYVKRSKEVTDFMARFRRRFLQDHPAVRADEPTDPTVYQLWAYDTAWAVALAIERVRPANLAFQSQQSENNSTDLGQLGVSQTGPTLLDAVLNTQFHGLAGEFQLVGGQLQSSAFEIVNINGKSARSIGFWTPENGIAKKLNSTNNSGLKSVIWPGDSKDVPKGWEIPTNGKKLRIAVPVKLGFDQFVKVETDPITNRTSVTGYCIDVFEAVIHSLPYAVTFEYIPFGDSAESYDNLVDQVFFKKFDAVVGDTTILANRSQHVDFTMPYTESGVSMIVPVKEDKGKNMWIFLKPLTMDLWLGSLAFFVFTGFVVWVIEHRENEEFDGEPLDQLGTVFYFAFSILVFAHKEKLTSNLTRFAVIIWVFVVLILTSSYTASLTSMLTVQQLQPTVTNVNQLLKKGAYVGYQDGSFVLGMLKRMGFQKHQLKNYGTSDQYAEFLLKGGANGGVDAIFDEVPYLKLFLSEHCDGFTMVGPTYKTDGFGFVFPRGSLLVPDISRAILNITEGEKMTEIEKAWFGDPTSCPSQSNNITSSSLDFLSFGGLFLITGVVSALALLIFLAKFIYQERNELKAAACQQSSPWKKIAAMLDHYHNVNKPPPPGPASKRDEFAALDNEEQNQVVQPGVGAELPHLVSPLSAVSTSSHSYFSSASASASASAEEGMSSTEPSSPHDRRPDDESSVVEMTEIREA